MERLTQLDRLTGVGLSALNRMSMAPAQPHTLGTSTNADRGLRSGFAPSDRRDSQFGAQRGPYQSYAEGIAVPTFGPNLNDAGGLGRRQLGTQATYGRDINAPGGNQPGLEGLMGSVNTPTSSTLGQIEGLSNIGSPGGKWAAIDQWDGAVSKAASKWGVDPNRIKAHMMIESGGNPNAVQNNPLGNTYGMMQINPQIWGETLRANGINMNTPDGNIEGAAYILSTLYKQYGSWDAASSAYFTGNPNWQGADTVNGTTGAQYQSTLNGYINELSSYGGSALNPNQQFRHAFQSPQGAATANSVLNAAKQYVGVAYNWGIVPGAGQNPWQTGWDCSGFTYWLDQTYGTGALPAGSHYQYAWAQQNGNLHGTDALQPGDLIFFATGGTAGGGANMNAASHVGVYLGGGQFLHAANEQQGTIVSDLNQYLQLYPFLGGASMSWSGGGSASNPTGGGTTPANAALRMNYSGYGAPYGRTLSKFSW